MGRHDSIKYQKQAIDLLSVVQRAGVELTRSGSRHVCLCPFHEDKSPSFFVFPDGHFHCFGCGEHGDVIDFVQRIRGCDFKEALSILDIRPEGLTSKKREDLKRQQLQRDRLSAFREWEAEAIDFLSTLCRACRTVLGNIRTLEDLEKYGPRYHDLATWEHHLDVLLNRDDKDKLGLLRDGTYG